MHQDYVLDIRHRYSPLQFELQRIVSKALNTKWIVPGTGTNAIENTDHFCGFLLQMPREESIRARERMGFRVSRQTSCGVSVHASTFPEWRQRRLQKSG